MEKSNLKDKFHSISTPWSPVILDEVNDTYVKLFKAEGEFVWHEHPDEDEFFLVIEGELNIRFENHELVLKAGESLKIPKGVRHLPHTPSYAHVLLVEPKETLNTGNAPKSHLTKAKLGKL